MFRNSGQLSLFSTLVSCIQLSALQFFALFSCFLRAVQYVSQTHMYCHSQSQLTTARSHDIPTRARACSCCLMLLFSFLVCLSSPPYSHH